MHLCICRCMYVYYLFGLVKTSCTRCLDQLGCFQLQVTEKCKVAYIRNSCFDKQMKVHGQDWHQLWLDLEGQMMSCLLD